MLKHWREVKAQHPEAILFYRVGDFYEMFYEDAELAARVLDITLTSRGDGVPLAGVPVKAAAEYLRQLVGAGHRVAICEQVEDPSWPRAWCAARWSRRVTPGALLQEGWLAGGTQQLPGGRRAATTSAVGLAADRPQHRRVPARDPGRGDGLAEALGRLDPAEVVVAADDLDASGRRRRRSAPCASAGSSIPSSRARSWPGGSRSPRSTASASAPRTRRRSAPPARCSATSTELQPGAAAPRAAARCAGATRSSGSTR